MLGNEERIIVGVSSALFFLSFLIVILYFVGAFGKTAQDATPVPQTTASEREPSTAARRKEGKGSLLKAVAEKEKTKTWKRVNDAPIRTAVGAKIHPIRSGFAAVKNTVVVAFARHGDAFNVMNWNPQTVPMQTEMLTGDAAHCGSVIVLAGRKKTGPGGFILRLHNVRLEVMERINFSTVPHSLRRVEGDCVAFVESGRLKTITSEGYIEDRETVVTIDAVLGAAPSQWKRKETLVLVHELGRPRNIVTVLALDTGRVAGRFHLPAPVTHCSSNHGLWIVTDDFRLYRAKSLQSTPERVGPELDAKVRYVVAGAGDWVAAGTAKGVVRVIGGDTGEVLAEFDVEDELHHLTCANTGEAVYASCGKGVHAFALQ